MIKGEITNKECKNNFIDLVFEEKCLPDRTM